MGHGGPGEVDADAVRRVHELGLRVALGARPRDLLLSTLAQGARWTLLGVTLGIARGAALVRAEGRGHEALSALAEARGELQASLDHYKAFHRLHDAMSDEEGRTRLRNLQIRLGVEQAEQRAEIERLRFVELAGMQAELVQSDRHRPHSR